MPFPYSIKKIKVIKNSFILKNSKFIDHRGSIESIFNKDIQDRIIKKRFNNYIDKFVIRKKNVITGIHGDNKTWKIISCIFGKIFLVLVNCDKGSKNFKKYFKIEIKADDCHSIIIPPKTGNSYLSMSKYSIIYYKNLFNGKYIDHNDQFTYAWNDPLFGISWPIKNPILSSRDKGINLK